MRKNLSKHLEFFKNHEKSSEFLEKLLNIRIINILEKNAISDFR
jgi:hypothetical protein